MGLITDLTGIADSILGIRDSLGAAIANVYVVTRTWTGTEPGDGTFADVVVQMLPTPAIKPVSNLRARQGGESDEEDMELRGISKQSYPAESNVDLSTSGANVEKFYRIDGKYYTVTRVESSYITWNVRVRKVAHEG